MGSPPKHILVVDDNGDVRDVIVAILQDSDYRVSEAAEGSAMRRVVDSGDAVDCVVLDAVMPGEPSDSLALHLRGMGIPVVMISGNPGVIGFAEDNGLPLLRKPFHSQELRNAVAKALAVREPRQRNA